MKLLRSVLLLTAVLLLVACGGSNGDGSGGDQQETISISGAFALFPMVTLWAEEYRAVNPNVRFDIQAGGAGKGMTDVLGGAVDIAMVSREMREIELEQGAYAVPVAIDAVLGTFNANNPFLDIILEKGFSPETIHGIWISGEITTWGQALGIDDDTAINVYTRSDAAGAAEMWAYFGGGEAQEDLLGTAVNADPGLAEAIRQDTLGVGFNNIGFAYDQVTKIPIAGLQIIPIDLNSDGVLSDDEKFYANRDDLTAAIAVEKYPFPPARVLYLVTRGEPSPAVADFYRWILSEGQAYIPDAGYVHISPKRLNEALSLVP
jgi:phosphate transport system substrate-binding protein